MDLTPSAAPGSVQYDRNRSALLDHLYEMDGRAGDHPHSNTYTGLMMSYRQVLGDEQMEELTRTWHLSGTPAALRAVLEQAA